ncbi:MAG TPA: hypothetical protein VNA13_03710 [Xanthomonadales bacterium]|nr:hypothetical protein [Xanthomonadales bacterium]
MNALRTIKNYLLAHFPVVAIVLIWGVLLITNYTPGAHLTGWDSLQTELDPGLAVKRAFYSSWQEYQSLGLPAGMGHAADLLRSVALYLASFIIPQSFIRYGFQMVMVLIGALGMLKLLDISGLKHDPSANSGQGKKSFAFLGALSYMLNYNIIQMMFLPYESFTIFLGMLPWEIWAFLKILKRDSKRKDWLIFFLVFVLATPQSQALQLFVVLMLILGLITLGVTFSVIARSKATKQSLEIAALPTVARNDKTKLSLSILKRAALAAIVIILINSFWLLPQLHFLRTGSSVVQTAKINQLSTQDVFYRNKDKGNIKDFLTYTGFFNDGVNRNQDPIFGAWISHRENLPVTILIYILSGVSILGIFAKSKYRLPFVFLYVLVLVSLLNNTPPFDWINMVVRKNSFINQIFRSPFTKFSILYALVASYFFAFGAQFIINNLKRIVPDLHLGNSGKKLFSLKTGSIILLSGLVIASAAPAFRGNYISPVVRIVIPPSYFEMFDYFKTVDKSKRIALLPEYTHWGWLFTQWGYDGSGFLWYGIEQPIISRNFDMWSTKSEGYYWEIKNALEKEDLPEAEKVLEKYGVDYLIFDHSVSAVVSSSKAIQDTRIEELLQRSSKIKLEKQWNFLTLYKVNHDKKIQDFVWVADQLPNIGPKIDLTNTDSAYNQFGNYQTNSERQYEMYYPFLDLITQTKPGNSNWEMRETDNEWIFTAKIPGDLSLPEKTAATQIALYHKGNAVNFNVPYKISANNNLASVRFTKVVVDSFQLENASLGYCVNKKGDIPSTQPDKTLRIEASTGDYICANYEDPNLDQKYGYIVKIENKNIEGQRLFFYAQDKTKDQAYIEDRLSKDTQYYILGNKYPQGVGYSFAFQANSYKTIPSVNEITGLSVYLMPYDVLKGLGIKMTGDIQKAQTSSNFEAKKLAYHKYIVRLLDSSSSTVVLNQAYQEGWHAYKIKNQKSKIKNYLNHAFPSIFGTEIKEHIIVNNWANGWNIGNWKLEIGNSSTIVLVYLPQYLQYLGFSLVILTLLAIIGVYRFDKKRSF